MLFYPEGTHCPTAPQSADALTQGMREGAIYESRALSCDAERNLHFMLGRIAGVMPREECAIGVREGKVRDIAILSRVGRVTCFTVTGVCTDTPRPYAVLSRRLAQEQCLRAYLSGLVPGDILPCRVTHLETFGAFCDVGCGVSALLPIDCMSVSRIASPTDRFCEGQNIFCAVKCRDALGRLVLTTRELFGTWAENAAHFHAGETVLGVVRSVESYGVFIELAPNLAGLAESGLPVKCGQTVSVFLKSIHPEKMKLKLAILQITDAPAPMGCALFPTAGHLSRWVYSPPGAAKCIETLFDE
ncbi:MAG: 30S ribosomal protein S1 [Ruthenibacterium sp.]